MKSNALTLRELSVVTGLLAAKSDKEIASSLKHPGTGEPLSVNTVKVYLHQLYRKFSAQDRGHLGNLMREMLREQAALNRVQLGEKAPAPLEQAAEDEQTIARLFTFDRLLLIARNTELTEEEKAQISLILHGHKRGIPMEGDTNPESAATLSQNRESR